MSSAAEPQSSDTQRRAEEAVEALEAATLRYYVEGNEATLDARTTARANVVEMCGDAMRLAQRLRTERDALLAALHEQGCPTWGRQSGGVYSGCGKCVACRADDIVVQATEPTP